MSASASPLAFYGLCAADPAAWLVADIALSIPFVKNILRQDYSYSTASITATEHRKLRKRCRWLLCRKRQFFLPRV